MKEFIDLIKKEWELAVFFGVVAALLLGTVCCLFQGHKARRHVGLRQGSPLPERLVKDEELAFLIPAENLGKVTVGPWGLPAGMLPRPAKKAVPQPKPSQPEPQTKPKPVPVVKARPAVIPAPVPKPAPMPRKLPRQGTLYFAEVQQLANGTRVALLELAYSDERHVVALGRGEHKYGLVVEGLSERNVKLKDARGRRLELRREEEGPVWCWQE